MNKYIRALNRLAGITVENLQGYERMKRVEISNSHHDIDALMELMHKTLKMKPNHKHDLKQFGSCPMCEANVNIKYHKGACGNCGQALDWN